MCKPLVAAVTNVYTRGSYSSLGENLFQKCLANVWPGSEVTREGQRMAKEGIRVTIEIGVRDCNSPGQSVHIFRFKYDVLAIRIFCKTEIERRQHRHHTTPDGRIGGVST